MKFNLFDAVRLKEAIVSGEETIAAGTLGTIVEVLEQGEAYLVELFGGWVKYDEAEDMVSATREDPDSFLETIGVETLYPHQLHLLRPARETVGIRAQLLALIEGMPEAMLEEVTNFAEFLYTKKRDVAKVVTHPANTSLE